jgi:hypothetical protein
MASTCGLFRDCRKSQKMAILGILQISNKFSRLLSMVFLRNFNNHKGYIIFYLSTLLKTF